MIERRNVDFEAEKVATSGDPGSCAICGLGLTKRQIRLGGIYCSRDCRDEARRTRNRQDCRQCGKTFYPASGNKSGAYCSRQCYDASRMKGEERDCAACGKRFYLSRWEIEQGRRNCSWECGRISNGQSHFIHGKAIRYRDAEFRANREILKFQQDGKCAFCGVKPEAELHCHHIVPYRVSKSHNLGNLVMLCASCHTRTDQQYRALEKVLQSA